MHSFTSELGGGEWSAYAPAALTTFVEPIIEGVLSLTIITSLDSSKLCFLRPHSK
jgi:hypothetical protein